MIIVKEIHKIPPLPSPLALTIGNFDGVHLGHLALLKNLREKVGAKGTVAVLTFTNHPSSVFGKEVPLICSLEEKVDLLRKAGVDLLILLTFTHELAQKNYKEFLKEIHSYYPFTYFSRGKGSLFGKNREGTEANVQALAQEMGFHAEYVNMIEINGVVVSSNQIRHLIEKGDLPQAALLLGRTLRAS